MMKLKWEDWQFSVITFAAAMLALFISMSIDLQRPYWSMMTVYIVSQPMAAAVRSKALYRLTGTLLGAAMALFLVPLLINAPALLCLALASWVAFCLAISMLDRSPRSYVMMLAGYTAAIIGFSSVNQPTEIFNLALARSEEIAIGIVCATVLHSLWFPKPFGIVLRTRFNDWMGMADQWASDILSTNNSVALRGDRLRLAAAASEIHIMATHLPFDISHFRETTSIVRALHDRILVLIPTLSSVSERIATMQSVQPDLDPHTKAILNETARWISLGKSSTAADKLIEQISTTGTQIRQTDWYGLNQISLINKLANLIKLFNECRDLLDHLKQPELPVSTQLNQLIAQSGARPLHSDVGMALLAGATALTAILVSCFFWINMGWVEGGASAMLAAILSCLFAAMDDPTPAMKKFGYSQLIAVPLAGIYIFAIFPKIDSFPMLVVSLAPTMLIIGILIARPASALLALITLLNMCNAMALQENTIADFASFANLNLSMFFGIFTAIFITRSFRSISSESNAKRLLKQTWKSLARLVQGNGFENPASFASQMVDRVGLLSPLLSASDDVDLKGMDTLNELRTGMDLVILQKAYEDLPVAEQALVTIIFQRVGAHYEGRISGFPANNDALLKAIDSSLSYASSPLQTRHAATLSALVGLRTNLFPNVSFRPHYEGAPS
jgi:uncharacterized membrane protein YccC